MSKKYTEEELQSLDQKVLIQLLLSMQDQIDTLNGNYEKLVEQIRISNANRYGRRSEKKDAIDGQMAFGFNEDGEVFYFNETEAYAVPGSKEPTAEEAAPAAVRTRKKKTPRKDQLKDIPVEDVPHTLSDKELDLKYGPGNWRRMKSEEYDVLLYTPASWKVEHHIVDVCVGTDGDHQDEFTRGKHPKRLIRGSIASPSLVAAIMNAKYVNALPVNRISQDFERFGIHLSRQTMCNWLIGCRPYLQPMWDLLKEELLSQHVTQADETPVNVIRDGRPAGSQSYMWVHRSGEFYTDHPIVLYEYQKTRSSEHPEEFYRDFTGILMTDSLEQYHKLERDSGGRITSANCFTHARRFFADAVKAVGKSDQDTLKTSVAHQAIELIAAIFHEEGKLKGLDSGERLKEREIHVRPKVDAYFAWVREKVAEGTVPPKGKTMQGLKYSLNNEKYLRVFLTDGDVPIDNSASERAIRPFTTGRKNWMFIESIKGADTSAVIYSLAETAKLNNLNPYYYFSHLLTELPKLMDEQGNMDKSKLYQLLPWAEELPEICRKPRR